MAPETFNPWTVVNLVFHHLAEHGLHPVLGEAGDPAVPAEALLRSEGYYQPTVEDIVEGDDGALPLAIDLGDPVE